MGVPQPLEPEESYGIPAVAATFPENTEAPEAKLPLISFSHYNKSECEMDGGEINPYAPEALRNIKNMGLSADFREGTYVKNAGEYQKLFAGLADISDQVEMKELRLKGKIPDPKNPTKKIPIDTGRAFYFKINNLIYIVAIRANHYETEKIRS